MMRDDQKADSTTRGEGQTMQDNQCDRIQCRIHRYDFVQHCALFVM
jgi:hypothetical protein